MFARTAFRTFQSAGSPMKLVPSRRYATGPSGGSGGGNNTAIIAAAALAAAAGGYYYFSSTGSGAGAAQKAAAKAKEAAAGAASAVGATSTSEAAGAAAKAAFTGGEQGFLSLELESAEDINHNTKHLRFKLPEPGQTSGLHTASALLTKFKPEDAEKPVIRPYTPVSDVDAKGYLELLIKRYEGGPMSSHIHALKPGDKLDFKGPIPKYPWAPNKHDQIVLVAGGTGITPMYQLIRTIFQNPEQDKTKVTLVFGNIAQEDILLHKEFTHLENTFPQRFRAFYVLEKPPQEWQGNTGYITKELLQQVVPEPTSKDNFKVFVCGPPGLMKAVSGTKKSPQDQGELSGILKELGYNKDQVFKF